jgi:hypothetical protein
MKLHRMCLILILALIPFSKAYSFEKYSGVEYQCNFHKDQDSTKGIPHINVFTGVKSHEGLAFEIGSYVSENYKMREFNLQMIGLHGTFVGHIPVCHNFSFKVGVGGCQFYAHIKESDKPKERHSVFVPRYLVGMDIGICNNFVGRVSFSIEQTSLLERAHKTLMNENLNLNIGFAYTM